MSYPKSDHHIFALTVYDVPVRSFLFTTRMRLTAMELHRLATTNLRSNHRLAISLPDLCYICTHKTFPEHFTVDIYCAILERFARQYEQYRSVEEDLNDVILVRTLDRCCSHLSTYTQHEEAVSARLHFLNAFTSRAIDEYLSRRYDTSLFFLPPDDYPRGEVYQQFRKNWQKNAAGRQFLNPQESLKAWHQSLIEQFKKNLEKLMHTPEYQESHQAQLEREREYRMLAYSQLGYPSSDTIIL